MALVIRWLPAWLRCWLLRQLQAADVRSAVTVVAEPTLIALWQARGPTLELLELLAVAGHPSDLIVEQLARQLTIKRPDLEPRVLRAALGIWVADELADLGATPVSVSPRTLGPGGTAPAGLGQLRAVEPDLEALDEIDDATGALPMPDDDPPDAA